MLNGEMTTRRSRQLAQQGMAMPKKIVYHNFVNGNEV
jgi:hypothetical protein